LEPHALERTPAIVRSNEWWRLITPIFINRVDAAEIGINLVNLAPLGALAERLLGPKTWLLVYLIAGLVGEAAGLAWKPVGAGSSVAFLGLLGAQLTYALLKVRA
jgi:rhomboid protease GluP